MTIYNDVVNKDSETHPSKDTNDSDHKRAERENTLTQRTLQSHSTARTKINTADGHSRYGPLSLTCHKSASLVESIAEFKL